MKSKRRRSGLTWVILVLLLALMVTGFERLRRSPHLLPWTPLKLSDPVGPFTKMKIRQLRGYFARCTAMLTQAGARFERLPPVRQGGYCGYADGVKILADKGFGYNPVPKAACPVAVSLAIWERQVIQPAALRHFNQKIASVETLGTYNCRRIGGSTQGRFSEHATANAIDVAAFTLANGKRITVLRDWNKHDEKAAFLRDVKAGSCRIFATTLSPDYNAAHRNHFHLDQASRGGFGICR
jgi:hypothetical protein